MSDIIFRIWRLKKNWIVLEEWNRKSWEAIKICPNMYSSNCTEEHTWWFCPLSNVLKMTSFTNTYLSKDVLSSQLPKKGYSHHCPQ